ncbi:MAG: hypothetical protein WBN75_20425, partial [Verrucomicrobiia bacterium]
HLRRTKPRADWKNDLQTYEESRKSPKPPTPFVGIKPYGKCQLIMFHCHSRLSGEVQAGFGRNVNPFLVRTVSIF